VTTPPHVPVRDIHGFVDDPIAYDDAAFPDWFWKAVTVTESGCWEYSRRVNRHKTLRTQEYVVMRLTQRPWASIFGCVPTCANRDCCNPAHLCVTFRETPTP
jgi:hypothetical protein